MNKQLYFPPEAEELVVRIEQAILSIGTKEFDEDENDCIFDDGNN